MAQRGELGDNLIPEWRFEWENGVVRTTEELPECENTDQRQKLIDLMVEEGKADDECEVTLLSYEMGG